MAILSGHTGDGRLILEDNEPESTGSVGLAVVDNLDRFDCSEIPEVIFQHALIGVTGAADKDLSAILVSHVLVFEDRFGLKLIS